MPKTPFITRFESMSDWLQAVILTAIALIVVLILLICHVLITDSQLPVYKARVDWFLAFGFVIGIIGAGWAIKARIDAGKAFRASEKTLNALGNSFSFTQILDENKLQSLIGKIGQDNTTISLYLGFPCVGYLYKDKHLFKKDPGYIFSKLKDKLSALNTLLGSKDISGFELNISCFSKTETEKILDGRAIMMGNDNLVESFYNYLDILKQFGTKDEKGNRVIVDQNFKIGEKLRFMSSYCSGGPDQENKAFIWIVPELSDRQKEQKTFDSAAFQTSELKFIEVLESVFTYKS